MSLKSFIIVEEIKAAHAKNMHDFLSLYQEEFLSALHFAINKAWTADIKVLNSKYSTSCKIREGKIKLPATRFNSSKSSNLAVYIPASMLDTNKTIIVNKLLKTASEVIHSLISSSIFSDKIKSHLKIRSDSSDVKLQFVSRGQNNEISKTLCLISGAYGKVISNEPLDYVYLLNTV